MKKFALLFFLISIGQNLHSQLNFKDDNKECNFISDYYPIVYKAHLYYLENKLDSALFNLNIVKKKCDFLNTPDILERLIFAEINVSKQKYNMVIESLEELVREGFLFEHLDENPSFDELKDMPEWCKLKLLSAEIYDRKKNHLNWDLRDQIISMVTLDQEVRKHPIDYKELSRIDSINQTNIKKIFERYGYPNEKIIGFSKEDEKVDISVMLMHFDDLEYFKPKLLGFIKRGLCNPYVLADMVDSNNRKEKIYTYGIYEGLDSTQIRDFKNLDLRRKSIGLSSLDDHNRAISLIMKKYGIELN